ncbi:MAG: hypothetical protein IID39_00400 [Planctomycetes bacterium]|nr:hypothetical protein [Planctomycetota bacterium]
MTGPIVKAYRLMATFALLNLIALGGGIGYLVSSDRLDIERVRAIAEMLGGDAAADTEGDETLEESGAQDGGSGGGVLAARSAEEERVAEEIAWRNAERYRTEIEQRLKFINAARLDVDRRREEFERLKDQEHLAERERTAQQQQAGYAKEIEIMSALSPKTALKQLMSMTDVDAARILFELETRKTKKIFETAKTDVEVAKMITIRRLIRDMKPDAGQGNTPGA